jgi:hypothetical protein
VTLFAVDRSSGNRTTEVNVRVAPSVRKNQNPNCIAEEECNPCLLSVMLMVRHRAKVKESIAGEITSDNGFSFTSDIE